jgi:hypothetical protein
MPAYITAPRERYDMLSNATLTAALWGCFGANMYALPRLSACYYTARQTGEPWGRCIVEALVALAIGTIAAAAFADWLAKFSHQTDPHAVAAFVGLLANTVMPAVINIVSARVLDRFKGGA